MPPSAHARLRDRSGQARRTPFILAAWRPPRTGRAISEVVEAVQLGQLPAEPAGLGERLQGSARGRSWTAALCFPAPDVGQDLDRLAVALELEICVSREILANVSIHGELAPHAVLPGACVLFFGGWRHPVPTPSLSC